MTDRWNIAPCFIVDDVVVTANYYRPTRLRLRTAVGEPPAFCMVSSRCSFCNKIASEVRKLVAVRPRPSAVLSRVTDEGVRPPVTARGGRALITIAIGYYCFRRRHASSTSRSRSAEMPARIFAFRSLLRPFT